METSDRCDGVGLCVLEFGDPKLLFEKRLAFAAERKFPSSSLTGFQCNWWWFFTTSVCLVLKVPNYANSLNAFFK